MKENKTNSDKHKLLRYLKSHDLMVIATQGDRPTAAAVYYGIDDDFNFYIIPPPATEHGKNILNNHKIACAIVDTHQPQFNTQYKIGVQVHGTAQQITEVKEMEKALQIWSKGRKDMVNTFMEHITRNSWTSRPFIIKPSEIKWFNEELYGEEGIEVFKFS